MKTFLIYSEKKINNHVGEYYDEIFEVPHTPTTSSIESDAVQIRILIKKLWDLDTADPNRDGDIGVVVYLDAASPYVAMLIDYQIVMEKEQGIKIHLPHIKEPILTPNDPEALELLRKLNKEKI
jgi:hypothetical protein